MTPYTANPLNIIGAVVSVKLTTGETFVGEIFCYETHSSNTIVLKEQTDPNVASFRIIKIVHIHQVTALSVPQPGAPLLPPLPSCSKALLEQKEQQGIAQFLEKRHTLGVNVSQDAQEIFGFIHKTHPDCCWVEANRIKVMGVVVSPPYTSENCEGEGRALERIKQVLDRFNQRKKNIRAVTSINTQQPKAWSYTQQGMNLPGYQNARRTSDELSSSVAQPGVAGHPPVTFNQIPYISNEDISNRCHSVPSYPVSGMGPQPVVFLNPAAVPMQPVGDASHMIPVQQGGNGLMLIVLQNPEDCIAAVGQPMFVAAPNTTDIAEHSMNTMEQHQLHQPSTFPNIDNSNTMFVPGLRPASTIAGPVATLSEGPSSTSFMPRNPSVAQPPRLNMPSRFQDASRNVSTNNIENFGAPGVTNRRSGSSVADADQPQTFNSRTPTNDVSAETTHSASSLPHGTTQGPLESSSLVNFSNNIMSTSDSRGAPCLYQQRSGTTLCSTNSNTGVGMNLISSPPKQATKQYPSIYTTSQVPYTQQQGSVSSTRSNNPLGTGPPNESTSINRLTPLLPHQASVGSAQNMSTGIAPYNQQNHASQRYQKMNSGTSGSFHEAQPPGRLRWNSSMRPQNTHAQNFSNSSNNSNSEGQHQQMRRGSLYSGIRDEGGHRSVLQNDSTLTVAVDMVSGLPPSGDHHHANQNMNYNGGSQPNYRSMNGGKGNRGQRNRGGGGRRHD